MKKRVDLKQITLLSNYSCTNRCRMCCYHCKPQSTGYITLGFAKKIISDIKPFNVKYVSILGGEPFLNLKVLLKIIHEVTKSHKTAMVFTNGFWARDLIKTKNIIKKLEAAGLDELRVSADGFHQEFVPFKNIVNIIRAVKDSKLRLIIENTYFINPRYKYLNLNSKQMKIISLYINSGPTRDIGRASDSLYDLLKSKKKKNKCNLVEMNWFGKLNLLTAVNIDYLGFVTICDGICIGNVNNSSLTDILDAYEANPHLIIDTLLAEGPLGLYRLAIKYGYQGSMENAKSDCNLCYKSRQFLAKKFSDLLAPINCYKENYEIN